MRKKKLELKKKVIAALSEVQKSKIIGGDDTDTTYAECPTGISGCANTCEEGCGSDTCPTYFCLDKQA